MTGKNKLIASLGLTILLGAILYNAIQRSTKPHSETTDKVVQNVLPVTDSEVARKNLEDVLSGMRPKPGHDNYEALNRYESITNKWIENLEISACIKLIDYSATADVNHPLVKNILIRLGELDHDVGLQYLYAKNYKDKNFEARRIIYVIEGWGKHDPENAWQYYLQLAERENFAKISLDTTQYVIFEHWSKQNHEVAYKNLFKLKQQDFVFGIIGYLKGLPETADFSKEALQLENAFKKYWIANDEPTRWE